MKTGERLLASGRSAWHAIGTRRDIDLAISLLRQSSEEGNADAMMSLAQIYGQGDLAPQDINLALEFLERAAEKDHSHALFQLGEYYRTGFSTGIFSRNIERDIHQARRLYERAAKLGNRRALLALVNIYAEGIGTEQNLAKAVELTEEAASFGSAHAMFLLGYLHKEGDHGLEANLEAAARWFRKSLRLISNPGATSALIDLDIQLLDPGHISMDRDYAGWINEEDLGWIIKRHTVGDWGDVSQAQWDHNDESIKGSANSVTISIFTASNDEAIRVSTFREKGTTSTFIGRGDDDYPDIDDFSAYMWRLTEGHNYPFSREDNSGRR